MRANWRCYQASEPNVFQGRRACQPLRKLASALAPTDEASQLPAGRRLLRPAQLGADQTNRRNQAEPPPQVTWLELELDRGHSAPSARAASR